MEIELKYAINSKETATAIWEDSDLKKIEEPETRETLFMDAIYFDTKDMDLSKNDIAYRVRREGDRLVASLKWGGGSEGALHKREEINIPVNDTKPNPVIFEACDIGPDLMRIISGKELQPLVEMHIERKRFRVEYEGSLLELSVDDGEIRTDSGATHVSELEIEIYNGGEEGMMKLGQLLTEKYDLVSEKRSKFYRGLMLLGER